METVARIEEVRAWSRRAKADGRRVALVPTMGYLHEGHLTLVREARAQADAVAVSIFVNPTQFSPNEDLDSYPRDLDRDSSLCQGEGADLLFVPVVEEMYPQGFQTRIEVTEVTKPLCGTRRPGHFSGVATVVAKLFHAVEPDVAVFGEKDYQQLQVIRRMTRDLNMAVRIVGVPTVRETDGLAMSSRNSYLNAAERQQALCLWNSMNEAKRLVAAGEKEPRVVYDAVAGAIQTQGGRLDYAELLDPELLQPVTVLDRPTLLALAVFVGPARLIDNCVLMPAR